MFSPPHRRVLITVYAHVEQRRRNFVFSKIFNSGTWDSGGRHVDGPINAGRSSRGWSNQLFADEALIPSPSKDESQIQKYQQTQ